jgi:hypothetical protein
MYAYMCTYGREEKCIIQRPDGLSPLGREMSRWENNTKIYLKG